MSERMGADIMELMGKTCDYLFKKEPRLLKEVHEVMGPVIKLHSEELEEKIAMQQEELNQQKEQLDKLIKNYILLYKKDGKTNQQAEQSLQEIFSITPTDAKGLLEKYW